MENYSTDPSIYNVKTDDPFPEVIDVDILEVTDRKITREIVNEVHTKLRNRLPVRLSGIGGDTDKLIDVVEIVKTKYKLMYQITQFNYITTIEVYSPLRPDLDAIEVRRSVPHCSIIISLHPVPGLNMSKIFRGKNSTVHLSEIENGDGSEYVSAHPSSSHQPHK